MVVGEPWVVCGELEAFVFEAFRLWMVMLVV